MKTLQRNSIQLPNGDLVLVYDSIKDEYTLQCNSIIFVYNESEMIEVYELSEKDINYIQMILK